MAEIDVEKERTRGEVASYLRDFADKLDPVEDVVDPGHESVGATGGKSTGDVVELGGENDRNLTIVVDNESATVTPPDSMNLRVQVETESSLLDTGMDRGVTFSLRWNADQVDSPDELGVE